MQLKELKTGQSAVITAVGGEGRLRQHFLDMGVIPGTQVKLVKLAPMGDPMQLTLHGYELSLRLAEAEKIEVEPIEKTNQISPPKKAKSDHPGLGEGGKFHPKGSGDPLPDDVTLTYALVGNQNSGKTTLFNQLTGSNQHVGNFPGVTVDRKDGVIKGHKNTLITDLPGIYCDFTPPINVPDSVIHQFLGAHICKTVLKIPYDNVINAVCYHTTGRKNMSNLEKIVFIADLIEENRNFSGVDEIRKRIDENFETGFAFAVKELYKFLKNQNNKVYYLTKECAEFYNKGELL